jgi:hypothetical protein
MKKWYPDCEYAQIQLILNLEKTQRRYKENDNEHWKEQPNLKVGDQVWFNNNISKQQGHQKSCMIKSEVHSSL